MQHDLVKIGNNISTTAHNLSKVVYALGNTSSATADDLNILIPVFQASSTLLYSIPVMYAAGTAIAAGTGFAAGKVIDTNDNPSNIKTAATACGSNIVAGGLSSALGGAFLNAQLSKLDMQKVSKLSPSELRKALKSAESVLHVDFSEIDDAVFADAGISRQNFDNLLNDASNAFVIAGYLTSAIALISMGMTVSNMIHGYRRNDKSVGYALAWMLTGPGGFGLSRAQGWGQPIGK